MQDMRKLFTLMLILILNGQVSAQVSCASFCITNVEMDTTIPNMLAVTLYMSGTSNDYANYPVITAIVDTAGDTVATGTLNFFLQYGGTSQVYLLNTGMTTVPPNFTFTAYFMYDTVNCILTYPCVINAISENTGFKLNVYPNPATDYIVFEIPPELRNGTLQIYNSSGQLLHDLPVESSVSMDVNDFAPGVFIYRFIHSGHSVEGKFRIE